MNTVMGLNAHKGRKLAVRMMKEDSEEDAGQLAPDDRLTCHVHGRWIHQCVSSSVHVNRVTRHRWCRGCEVELTVAVDELTGTVEMSCSGCEGGLSAATAKLVDACRRSLAVVRRVGAVVAVAA
jgi:hypothetical protein